jgi:hypothetical protein
VTQNRYGPTVQSLRVTLALRPRGHISHAEPVLLASTESRLLLTLPQTTCRRSLTLTLQILRSPDVGKELDRVLDDILRVLVVRSLQKRATVYDDSLEITRAIRIRRPFRLARLRTVSSIRRACASKSGSKNTR